MLAPRDRSTIKTLIISRRPSLSLSLSLSHQFVDEFLLKMGERNEGRERERLEATAMATTTIVKIYARHFFRVELFDVSLGSERHAQQQQHIPKTSFVRSFGYKASSEFHLFVKALFFAVRISGRQLVISCRRRCTCLPNAAPRCDNEVLAV